MLIVYDAPAFTMDLARNVVKTAVEKGVGIDSIAYKSAQRLGDEIMKYMGVLMLVDPNNVSVQWQTDLERYIQSGGGMNTTEDIYDPFYTTKKGRNQRGMGLSLARKVIVKHNGSISFDNTELGVIFKIVLPLELKEISTN